MQDRNIAAVEQLLLSVPLPCNAGKAPPMATPPFRVVVRMCAYAHSNVASTIAEEGSAPNMTPTVHTETRRPSATRNRAVLYLFAFQLRPTSLLCSSHPSFGLCAHLASASLLFSHRFCDGCGVRAPLARCSLQRFLDLRETCNFLIDLRDDLLNVQFYVL